MTRLVSQQTNSPTRKMWAVIISGVVVATIQTLLKTYAPGFPLTEMLPQIDVWVQAAVMVVAGYVVRNEATP